MKVVVLNGRKRKLQSTFEANRYLLKKYDYTNNEREWSADDDTNFLVEAFWLMLKPNIFGVKPFFTFRRFQKKADLEEMKRQMNMIFSILHAIDIEPLQKKIEETLSSEEDREQGNVTP